MRVLDRRISRTHGRTSCRIFRVAHRSRKPCSRFNRNLSTKPDKLLHRFGGRSNAGFASGGFEFNGKGFTDPATYPVGYHQLSINALPYCFPAVIGYTQPTTGTIATWALTDTPAIGSGSAIKISSSNGDYEGTSLLNGLVYAQADIHIHHTRADKELVTFRGAELAWKIHNCDFFNFTYDPQVACTKFLGLQGGGTPGVLSFREIR